MTKANSVGGCSRSSPPWSPSPSVGLSIDAEAALELAERVSPFAPGMLAIATALAPQRMIATCRTLRSRQLTAVVPADDFDANADVVLSDVVGIRQLARRQLCFMALLGEDPVAEQEADEE